MNNARFHVNAATLFGVSLVFLVAQEVTAAVDCERLSLGNRVPTVEELTRCLNPGERGLRPLPEGTEKATQSIPPMVALKVNFEFSSYSLTPEAKVQLQNLGAALKTQELRNDSFVIEGHTDSVGSEGYNQRLSMYRAQAVKRYLVQVVGIEPDRLVTVGLGERQPLGNANPASDVNRRVQFVNQRTQ